MTTSGAGRLVKAEFVVVERVEKKESFLPSHGTQFNSEPAGQAPTPQPHIGIVCSSSKLASGSHNGGFNRQHLIVPLEWNGS